MHFLQCSIPVAGYPRGVVTRPSPDGDGLETLVIAGSSQFRLLIGADKRGGLEIGPALELLVPGKAGTARRWFEPTNSLRDPIWDPFSASIFFMDGQAVMRLSPNNTVTLLAGHRSEAGDDDGQGATARFVLPRFPVSDGAGSLFLADGCRICRVKLPTTWRTWPSLPPTAAEPSSTTSPFEPDVTTLLTVPGDVTGLAYVHEGGIATAAAAAAAGSLIYATETAVYRLPLGSAAATAGGGGGGGSPGNNSAALVPVLLAGCEGAHGSRDGCGATASFHQIAGLVEAGDCRVFLSDVDDSDGEGEGGRVALRQVVCSAGGVEGGDGDGIVTTLAPHLKENAVWPSILPNGYVALCNTFPEELLVLDLGITPPPRCRAATVTASAVAASGVGACPPRRSLSADLCALLDRQPDGTSDLTLTAGDRTFHVHRAILAARCDYFRQRLTGGFLDSEAPLLDLPDADPNAVTALLRFLYTGALENPPPQQLPLLQPLAELADRLLLPELCTAAQVQLLAAVAVDNVVELLVWAWDRGDAFGDTRRRLVAWYLGHQVEVMERNPRAVKCMMVSCPDLAFELHMASAMLAARR